MQRIKPAPVAFVFAMATGVALGGIAENQTLVVYNSASSEGSTLALYYWAAHPDIPAANFFNLNNAALLTADVTQAQFASLIRDPIRNFLSAAGAPDPEDIIAIVLIRPIPHRVLDTDNSLAGDTASSAATELTNGDATYASVDAELVLLWQNLTAGEAGGTMDSHADNVIVNPYHTSTSPIDGFSRTNIQAAKTFNNRSNVVWTLGGAGAARLTPGDLYLVARIDGTTLADAETIVDRAQNIVVNKAVVRTLFDEYDVTVGDELDDDPLFTSNDPFLAGDDFEEARNLLLANGWDVRYDGTSNFISSSEEVTPLIAYSSYGEIHTRYGENPPGVGTYIEGFHFADGAMFNTTESFNGRALNGLATKAGQEQVADFLASGGTFGVAHVFEPFTFTLADNEFLFVNMLVRHMTWGEAAYTALPALSWQDIVVGDPLASYASIVSLLGDCDADIDVDSADTTSFVDCLDGPDGGVPNGCKCADFDGDGDIDLIDFSGFERVFTGG